MHSLICLLVVVSVVLGEEMISDPGFQTVEGNMCASEVSWWFKSEFIFNATNELFDSQCIFNGEYPTAFRPGLTKGTQTNINQILIPDLPEITGVTDPLYANSAGIVDMNSPCRAAVWAPFTLVNNMMKVQISLQFWAKGSEGISQSLIDGSDASNAEFLQYQSEPEGLLQPPFGFPPVEERTNMIRVDIMRAGVDFWDRAFGISDDDVYMNIPVSDWVNGWEVPAEGTNEQWIELEWESAEEADGGFGDAGTYAIRFASAQSNVGVTWGVSNVHVNAEGGVDPTPPPEPIIYDVIVDNSRKTIGGTAIYSKIVQ